MKYSYTARDTEKEIEMQAGSDGKPIKDPITINIKIEIDRKKYQSTLNKYKTPIIEKILAFFK